MRNEFSQLEDDGNPYPIAWKILAFILVISAAFGAASYGFGWFSEAGKVAKDEFGPKAALVKYEWFVDAANQVKASDANIKSYRTKMKALESQYAGKPRGEWARDDRESQTQWASELAGIVANRNNLVAEYNANSKKFNWSFAKTHDPAVPTEFRDYEEGKE